MSSIYRSISEQRTALKQLFPFCFNIKTHFIANLTRNAIAFFCLYETNIEIVILVILRDLVIIQR